MSDIKQHDFWNEEAKVEEPTRRNRDPADMAYAEYMLMQAKDTKDSPDQESEEDEELGGSLFGDDEDEEQPIGRRGFGR